TYLFNRGDGQDTINDQGYGYWGAGGADRIVFGPDVAASQIWLRRVGNSLELSLIGTSDKTTVENWYSDAAYRIEELRAGDGKVLLDSQVEALVTAMAAFAPPAAGQTSLPQAYQGSLETVLAASWR
ncbi:MAG: calcium-binding protein, partial [Candidatus Dactylopiibacterium sp.]|nr:calcium-binding protein [Candidatus Dactylopiibacterium sp.]